MKKALIIIGSFILFLIIWATTFKLMHWPGAGPLFVVGITFFSIIFLPLFFIERIISNPKALNIVTNIFALISSCSLFMGVMFKIMHWPGAGPLIVFGAFFLVIPTLILYIIQQFKEYDRKFREFWRTVVFCILASVFLIFWGLNVSRNVLISFLNVEDVTLATNKNLAEYNAYILEDISSADSNSIYKQSAVSIAKQSDGMLQYIEDIKRAIISRADVNPEALDNHWYINAKDNYDIPTHVLCGQDGSGRELFNKLVLFKASLLSEMKNLPLKNTSEETEKPGDLGIRTELNPELMEFSDNWQDAMFYQQTIASSLALLTGIQTQVLNAEFNCLKTIKMDMK